MHRLMTGKLSTLTFVLPLLYFSFSSYRKVIGALKTIMNYSGLSCSTFYCISWWGGGAEIQQGLWLACFFFPGTCLHSFDVSNVPRQYMQTIVTNLPPRVWLWALQLVTLPINVLLTFCHLLISSKCHVLHGYLHLTRNKSWIRSSTDLRGTIVGGSAASRYVTRSPSRRNFTCSLPVVCF